MANFISFVLAFAIVIVGLVLPGHSQLQKPCTSSMMLTSFTPCMNYVTSSTGSGVPPTADCCNSLKSLMSGGTNCMCLMITGNVPFQLPVNRTMAIALPKACNMAGVPLQCKAAVAAPISAPGPIAYGSTLSPTASTTPSTDAAEPSPAISALAPEADSTPALTPPNTGSKPVLTPSSATNSHQFSPSLVFFILAGTILKFY